MLVELPAYRLHRVTGDLLQQLLASTIGDLGFCLGVCSIPVGPCLGGILVTSTEHKLPQQYLWRHAPVSRRRVFCPARELRAFLSFLYKHWYAAPIGSMEIIGSTLLHSYMDVVHWLWRQLVDASPYSSHVQISASLFVEQRSAARG